jgi:hypothetical protein
MLMPIHRFSLNSTFFDLEFFSHPPTSTCTHLHDALQYPRFQHMLGWMLPRTWTPYGRVIGLCSIGLQTMTDGVMMRIVDEAAVVDSRVFGDCGVHLDDAGEFLSEWQVCF